LNEFTISVIPAQAGILRHNLDSRLRGNDGSPFMPNLIMPNLKLL
jgi:hypothetical protein